MSKIITGFFILSTFLGSWPVSAAPKKITMGITHYPPYADKNKEDLGIYPKYLKAFFNSQGVKVDFQFLPYARTIDMVKKKQIDSAIFGISSIKDLVKTKSLIATKPFYQVEFCLFYNSQKIKKPIQFKGFESLKGYSLVSIYKSPVNEEIKKLKLNLINTSDMQSALKMIEHKRVDIFLNSKAIGQHYIKELKLKNVKCQSVFTLENIVLATAQQKKLQKVFEAFNQHIRKYPLTN